MTPEERAEKIKKLRDERRIIALTTYPYDQTRLIAHLDEMISLLERGYNI